MRDDTDWARLAKYLSGECLPDEIREFDEWIDQHPDRRKEVELLRAAWEQAARQHYSSRSGEALVRVMARLRIGIPEVLAASVEPRDSTFRESKSRHAYFSLAWRIAAVLFLVVVPLTLWPQIRGLLSTAPRQEVVQVPAGVTSTVQLPGEIVVRLGPDSRLAFRPKRGRVSEVEFVGEAYFTVPHDPSRPFSVVTASGVVRDIGTEFNVRSRDSVVAVTVVEGEVELEAAGGVVRIHAGEWSTARAGRPPEPASTADPAQALAWIDGVSVFRNETLAAIAVELERRHGVPFSVAQNLRGKLVTATIRGRTAEYAARMICAVIDGKCEPDGDGWLISER